MVKSARSHKHSKTEDLLVSLAESVGSTLGAIAAKAGAAQKALSRSDITGRLERGGKKIVRRSKELVSNAVKTNKSKHPKAKSDRSVSRQAARRAKTVVRKARTMVRGAGSTVRRGARART